MKMKPLKGNNSMPVIAFGISLMLVLFAFPLFAMAKDASENLRIVVLGDSLVAGYQLKPGEGFPEQLQQVMDPQKSMVEFVNAGVSGDTSAAGLARLDWSVGDDVDGVILELGANDALRGISPETTRKNLVSIIEKLSARKIAIMLVGMLAPPNMGEEYGKQFNEIYPELAKQHDLVFYPFFLDGVAANSELNLDDGMHPNPKGVGVIVERIEPVVKEFLDRLKTGS